jgi:tripeptidyl-peptidase-1
MLILLIKESLMMVFLLTLILCCRFYSTTAILYNDADKVLIESTSLDSTNISGLTESDEKVHHTVMFVCKRRNMDKLKQTLMDISVKINSQHDLHMSKEQVNELTINQNSVNYVKEYMESKGILIDEKKSSENLIVAASTISEWQKLFNNKFHEFEVNGELHKMHRSLTYSLPKHLSYHVEYVHYLLYVPIHINTDAMFFQKTNKPETLSSGPVYNGFVSPQQLINIYNITGVEGNNLTSQAFFGSLGQQYNSYDISLFQNFFKLKQQSIVGTYGVPGGVADTCQKSNVGNCANANLDAGYLMGLAPSTPTYYNYVVSNANGGFDWNVWLSSIVALSDPPSVLTIRYFSGEPPQWYVSEFDSLAMLLAARGVSLIAVSGDNGAHSSSSCSYTPLFPATSQYVTVVGSTMGLESKNPEVVCSYSSSGAQATSGGGFSNVVDIPDWQAPFIANYFNTVDGTSQEPVSGFSRSGRGYPDISLTGFHYIAVISASFFIFDGSATSVVTFGAMVSLVNAARLKKGFSTLGWLNPLLYANHDSFILNDITSGNNKGGSGSSTGSAKNCAQGFYATNGWDPVSGLGSVNFQKFLSTFLPKPTLSPTSKPTALLNKKPTAVPSFKKTYAPTLKKNAPSGKPTLLPTAKKTAVISRIPTLLPTEIPTSIPSTFPTENPTFSPTSVPTNIPTPLPTYTPTTSVPSRFPTNIAIKVAPSSGSVSVTKHPTKTTHTPTRKPSLSPTIKKVSTRVPTKKMGLNFNHAPSLKLTKNNVKPTTSSKTTIKA